MSELKKISAYVPKELYDCLKKDKEESEISFSQAIIAALANHYNIEVTVGKSGRRVTLGGETATAGRVDALEQKFEQFSYSVSEQIEQILSAVQSNNQTINRNKVDYKQSVNGNDVIRNQSIDKLLDEPITETPVKKKINSSQQLALVDIKTDIKPFTGRLLSLRLGVSKSTISNLKKKSIEGLKKWSSERDPDNIIWIFNPNGTGYLPSENLTEPQLLKLQQWITANS